MTIDEPLRDERSQPRRQAAAAVKIAEYGLADAVLFLEAEQFRIQRGRDFSRAASGIHRIRGAIHAGPEFLDEVVPRILAPHRARAGQREIGKMEGVVVAIELVLGWNPAGKGLF